MILTLGLWFNLRLTPFLLSKCCIPSTTLTIAKTKTLTKDLHLPLPLSNLTPKNLNNLTKGFYLWQNTFKQDTDSSKLLLLSSIVMSFPFSNFARSRYRIVLFWCCIALCVQEADPVVYHPSIIRFWSCLVSHPATSAPPSAGKAYSQRSSRAVWHIARVELRL